MQLLARPPATHELKSISHVQGAGVNKSLQVDSLSKQARGCQKTLGVTQESGACKNCGTGCSNVATYAWRLDILWGTQPLVK